MMMMCEEPLRRIVEYSLNSLSCIINNEEIGLSMRKHFFSITNKLPILCRSMYEEAKQHIAFEYILFYERTRLQIPCRSFFFDGVPHGVNLIGPTTVNIQPEEIQNYKFCDVIINRFNTVYHMESMVDRDRKNLLIQLHAAELPIQVPGPIRFVVARLRAVFRSLREIRSPNVFTQCNNCNCNRMFYRGDITESWSNSAVSEVYLGGDEDEETNSNTYWNRTIGISNNPIPDARRFCSRACANQHALHFKLLMPDSGLHLDADDIAKKAGRARVVESFRLAKKRNEKAARALRTIKTKMFNNIAVSKSEVDLHHEQKIRSLNIDLGLLYAASLIAECATMSNGITLPGQNIYWRDNPIYYARALRIICTIYDTNARKEGIISSTLTMPKFLTKLKSVTHKLF
jgi:hypothetical protein